MMQILSPAGSFPALQAAVAGGADAVYFGAPAFNARMGAANFTEEEMREGIRLCHERGVSVHATLNTLVSDRELDGALRTAQQLVEAGADALIVQDLGLARELSRCTDVPLHASTQLTIHSLEGAERMADLGFSRVVLSRELSRSNIAYITAHSPIETEIFVHGALCMCYSGQCYMSSVIGARSGNRGRCAQPCRLPYAGGYALSLKDLCLLKDLDDIASLGVSCVKIEGRMKSPSYVYAVTRAYADRKHGKPYGEETERYLAGVFSRGGFTDGYYRDRKGPEMFGVRSETTETPRVEKKEYKRFFLDLSLTATPAGTITVRAETEDGYAAEDELPAQEAQSHPLTEDDAKNCFGRLGDTVYTLRNLTLNVTDLLFLPAAQMNASRRRLLEHLTQMRLVRPYTFSDSSPVCFPQNMKNTALPRMEGWFLSVSQIPPKAETLSRIWVPLTEVHKKSFGPLCGRFGNRVGVALPPVVTDDERLQLRRDLAEAAEHGVQDVLVGNLGQISAVREAGLRAHGDYGLNVFNRLSAEQCKTLGLSSCTLSFEMNLAQLRDAADAFCTAIVYGRLPFMVTENCVKQKTCGKPFYLADRTGRKFLVTCLPKCRNRLWNSDRLYMADRDFSGCGAVRLLFTDEPMAECDEVLRRFEAGEPMPEVGFTRGLYNKKV